MKNEHSVDNLVMSEVKSITLAGHFPVEEAVQIKELADTDERSISKTIVRLVRLGLKHYQS